ncbi:MAG TPA: trypsin-like peptidase domain-containing protein [Baekduia sp.]|nr:trypsin-like peptidase domain-containing protein [Baekduia sp.]
MSADDEMWKLLSAATVRISSQDGTVCGMGFFIEPKRVLTTAQVAVAARTGKTIETAHGVRCLVVTTERARPWERQAGLSMWPMPDLAVLAVEDVPDDAVSFVELSDSLSGTELLTVGNDFGAGPVVLSGCAAASAQDYPIFTCDGDALLSPQVSGSPVLDPDTGMVVGLIKADRANTDGGTFVIAGASIRQALPAEWESHLEAHAKDPMWRLTANRARYSEADATTLSEYLRALSQAYTVSPMLPPGLERGDVRQPVRVRPLQGVGTQIEGGSAGADADDAQEDSARLGEALLWDPLRSPWAAVVVVAGPGMGKTWLLNEHAAQIAAHSLAQLGEQPERYVDVRVPVFVNAAAFARRLPMDAGRDDIVGALASAIAQAPTKAPEAAALTPLLGLALEDGRIALCVDGLDEVPDDLRGELGAALALLEQRCLQLVISGRESARPLFERVFGGEHEEFEITGFSPGDVRRFVRAWHHQSEKLVAKVERSLTENPSLLRLAHVPLLLSFVCRLAVTDQPLASTRSGLYRDVALSVLSGSWKDVDHGVSDSKARLELLARAVGPLAASWRGRPDEFPHHEVVAALEKDPEYQVVQAAAKARWDAAENRLRHDGRDLQHHVIWEFMHDGLLMNVSTSMGRPMLRFTHLVFGELCVAMWLASLSPDDGGAEQIEHHRWFDDQWLDVIPIACGVGKDPRWILKCIAEADADPWLAQALLEARCMAEAAPSFVDRDAVVGLIERVVARLNTGPRSDAENAHRCLEVLVAGRVRDARAYLVELMQADRLAQEDDRDTLMRTLCQAGEQSAIDACSAVVQDSSLPQRRRDEASRAICRSSDQDAVKSVIEVYLTRRGSYQHLAVVLTDSNTATSEALELVRKPEIDQMLRVAIAIQQINVNGNHAPATELLINDAVGLVGRVELVVALLRAGHPVEADIVPQLTIDPNVTPSDKLALAHALLLRGDFSALPMASGLVIDSSLDFERRRDLARTMFSIGKGGAAALYNSATDINYSVEARVQALRVLIERRHAAGAQAAARIITNGQGSVWARAMLMTYLLDHSSGHASSPSLINLLADLDLTGQYHSTWEELAPRALRHPDAAVRDTVRERILRRLRDPDSTEAPDGDLKDIDIGRLFRILGSQAAGLELLVEIAHDARSTVDARIGAAMTAVQSDVGCVPQLDPLLDDTALQPSVRDRLVIAFAMLGAVPMLPRIMERLPSSEPAYVSLRATLRSAAITREAMLEGLGAARSAVFSLQDIEPPRWDLDFGDLVKEMQVDAKSEAQRQIRYEMLASDVRQRTYGRLLQLLLPSEQHALYLVGQFADTSATRDWLAAWIPAYREIAEDEMRRLQAVISKPGFVWPDVRNNRNAFARVSDLALLLREWDDHITAGRWSDCFQLMVANASRIQAPQSREVLRLARSLETEPQPWHLHPAQDYLLHVAATEGLLRVQELLSSSEERRQATSIAVEAKETLIGFSAGCLYIMMAPNEAPGYFYAAEALLLDENYDGAAELMRLSAEWASPQQAWQGRLTLRRMQKDHNLPADRIEELRDILGTVDGATQETEPTGDDDAEGGDDASPSLSSDDADMPEEDGETA